MIMFLKYFVKKAKVILKELYFLHKQPLLIAIDGLTGAGKTTLALELQKLDPIMQLAEMDSFFLPLKKRSRFHFHKSAHEEYDYERIISQVLLPFQKRIPAFYNKYNWVTDMIESENCEIKPDRTLILDGTTSLHPALQNAVKFDCCIWVESPAEIRHERAKKRDDKIVGKLGGYNEKTKDYFVKEWIPMENTYFRDYRPDKKADIIVNN